MKKRKAGTVRLAQKGRGFLVPRFSFAARRFMILVSTPYIRFVEGIAGISFFNEERIINAMKGFHSGEHRLIFVFRHAAKEDPPVLMYSFNNILRRRIQKEGGLSHLRILYGRDVPNWAGAITVWLFPRIGAIPVQNRAGNRQALDLLRREMKEGRFPVILAPEEQVVYHMYRTFGAAPGISSLVEWGLESGKPVTVVPIAMGYRHDRNPEAFIRKKLSRWEKLTGLRLENTESGKLHPLLVEAADKTVGMLEAYLGSPAPPPKERNIPEGIDARINTLCDILLTKAEEAAGLSTKTAEEQPDRMERLFRVRYAGTAAFFPEGIEPADQPELPRALMDFTALKAEVSIRYERIVDVLEYVHMSYITPPFPAGRGCEFILNLLDVINRICGGDISSREKPSRQKAAVFAGSPLVFKGAARPDLSRRERLDQIREDVRSSLQQASEELEPLWETKRLE